MMSGDGPSPLFDLHFRMSSPKHPGTPDVVDDNGDPPKFCFCVRVSATIPDDVTQGPLGVITIQREFHELMWDEEQCFCIIYDPSERADEISRGLRARGFSIEEVDVSQLKRKKVPHGIVLKD